MYKAGGNMKRIKRRAEKKFKIFSILSKHIINNRKEYIVAIVLFLIGIIIGVIFINNVNDEKFKIITDYIINSINNIKNINKIDYIALLKESLISNTILVLIMWFVASTLIGIPIVYGVIVFRGFVFGYTISSIIASLGIGNGFLFILSSLLIHNIIFIPGLLALGVSGMKIYKSIVKNKERDNVKIEFLRHTIFCIIILILLSIASIIEVYISTNLTKILANYMKI